MPLLQRCIDCRSLLCCDDGSTQKSQSGAQGLTAAAASAAQDKLYKEKFSALPGLNSPARLIREIVRPPRSRLHATSAGVETSDASPATPVA